MFVRNICRAGFRFAAKTRLPFKDLEQSDLSFFKSILPQHHIITDSHELQPFNTCWRKLDIGHSQLALTPSTVPQVSAILKYCNQNNIAVVPQGGNTGLVGGSVPIFDEIILSTKNLNKIQKFDPISSVVTCEAGVILEKLNEHLFEHGCQIPLDLGAKGSCQIGGNAATAAGGKYVLKHGLFRSHIRGLQVVLPNGDILDMTSQIQKDNTGYDLKHFFIGSEGTLGIITKLNINCAKLDHEKKVIVFKADSFSKIIESLPILRNQLGKQLFALEYLDSATYKNVKENLGLDIMEVQDGEHLLFVETTSDEIQDLLEKLPEFLDSIMSTNDQEYYKIWRVREDVAFSARITGKVLSYDVSFHVGQWQNLLEDLRKNLPHVEILGYGHIGDGNLHINVCTKNNETIDDRQVFERVTKYKGSISAEHGIANKIEYLHLQKSNEILNIHKQIKKMFDPKGIMNPYKCIPE